MGIYLGFEKFHPALHGGGGGDLFHLHKNVNMSAVPLWTDR